MFLKLPHVDKSSEWGVREKMDSGFNRSGWSPRSCMFNTWNTVERNTRKQGFSSFDSKNKSPGEVKETKIQWWSY